MVTFIPLRSYAEGFHASSHAKCFWLSTLAVTAILIVARLALNIYSAGLVMLSGIICATIIAILAPVQDANKPLDDAENRIFKRRTRKIVSDSHITPRTPRRDILFADKACFVSSLKELFPCVIFGFVCRSVHVRFKEQSYTAWADMSADNRTHHDNIKRINLKSALNQLDNSLSVSLTV